jgi:hypothetical protein|tara:strand:- start:208 stop:456 length:249 start_codon:yes stop_codon:yes gene_type:complete
MSNYKKINEGIVDKFIEKVFSIAAKGKSNKVLKDLSKKDPELGKLINQAIASGAAMEKKLKKMSPEDREDLVQKRRKTFGMD